MKAGVTALDDYILEYRLKLGEAIKEIRESVTDKDVKQENTQVNIYQNISDQINENVSRLIDVSNKKTKSGIEKII
jgi:hypothetical protein